MAKNFEIIPEQVDFILQVMKFFEDHELHEFLYWSMAEEDDKPITFWIIANDLFEWGCGDCEDITEDNFSVFKQAVKDCEEISWALGGYGCELFACRVRKMRPQGAAYPKEQELWSLFDACGPKRELGAGNPCEPGES